ncbi:MAG: rod shape-determining protein MreC, partial [Clostridia bacterium]|nr:rod shape-determining protein MreC [Clostridia bacterium]
MKNFLKSPGFKILVVVAAFLMGVFIYSAAVGGVATLPEQLFGAILAPIQSVTSGITDGVGGFF